MNAAISGYITRAEGFFELGMFDEAWNEIEELPPIDRVEPLALELRLRILTALDKLELGGEIASVLMSSAIEPARCRETVARFHHARAVRLAQAGKREAARRAIRAASDAFPGIRLELLDDERISSALWGE